jgi:predicted ferric reductase
MTRIRIAFWALLVGLPALWLAAETSPRAQPYAQGQFAYANLTGILAMGVMAVALVLALRSTAVEPRLGGLDKSYRLHKWLGVLALVAIIAHWLVISYPEWFVAMGIIAPRLANTPRPTTPEWLPSLSGLRGPARTIGDWCFWIGVALIALAPVKRVPYRWFLRTHRWLAIIFLLLVFHSVVLLRASYWSHAVGWVIAALMAGGAAAALYIFVRRVGRTRQAVGEVEGLTHYLDGSILGVEVCLKDRWPGHTPGQFAFVDFEDGEGPHPFTISSSWKDNGALTFLIKGLGDYTRALPSALTRGMLVTVEGPYGGFTFAGSHSRQIWISGGIGIAPFISRLQDLEKQPDGKTVDFFHATVADAVEEIQRLRGLAERAHVTLHLWDPRANGRLTGPILREAVPEWRESDVWFCGPVEFGNDMRLDLFRAGLPASAFHQELFHLR